MKRTREKIMEERRALKAEYGELFDAVSCLLFRADPIGISFDDENLDEYDPEAGTILPRLKTCEAADDVLRVVHEEFVRWFGLRLQVHGSFTNQLPLKFGSCGNSGIADSIEFDFLIRNAESRRI